MLLPHLISGREASKVIVVEQSIEAPASALLIDSLVSSLQKNEKPIFITQDATEKRWKSVLRESLEGNVDRLAFCSLAKSGTEDQLKGLVETIDKLASGEENGRVLIVFESLHLGNLRGGPVEVALLLDKISKLLKDRGRIIAQYHCDIPFTFQQGRSTLEAGEVLRSVATSYVHLSPASEDRSNSAKELLAAVEHKKMSGKIVKENVIVRVQGLKVINMRLQSAAIQSQPSSSSASQPEASFNLSMTDEQRAARDRVVLPFVKAQTDEFRIEYTGDSDEEDPDGDLDI